MTAQRMPARRITARTTDRPTPADPVRGSAADAAGARTRDLVTGLFGVWLLLAVFTDGWAHFNRPGLETFFTPWHAVLYSGLAAMAGWILAVAWRNRTRAGALWRAVPPGYGATVAGVAVFAVGGGLDLAWHEAFGIEVAVDALVSPPHLMLGAGGLLILGTGMRSQRAVHGGRWTWTAPALLSVVLLTALAAFFLIYTSAFAMPAVTTEFVPRPEGTPGHEAAELPAIAGLAGYLVTTALLVVPIVLVLASGSRAPRFTVTTVVATVAWLSAGIVGFPTTAVAVAVGTTVAAVVSDAGLSRLSPATIRRRLPLLVATVAALVWAGQLVGVAVTDQVRWPVSLWLGVVVLSAGLAAALGALASAGNVGRVPDRRSGEEPGRDRAAAEAVQ